MSDVLVLDSVSTRIDGKLLLNKISFSVSSGESAALLGPSGSGKSLLLSVCSGNLKPSSGKLFINGYTDELPPPHQLKTGLVFSVDEQRYRQSVYEILLKAASAYRGIDSEHIESTAAALGLRAFFDTKFGELTESRRRLTELATAFVGNPRLILLDNPFDSLNPDDCERLSLLIDFYCRKKGAAALFATGQCGLAEKISSKAIVLLDGVVMDTIDVKHINDGFKSQSYRFSFTVDKPYSASAVLSEAGYSPKSSGETVSAIFSRKQLNQVLKELIKNGISIYDISSSEDRLQDRYTDALLFMGGYAG